MKKYNQLMLLAVMMVSLAACTDKNDKEDGRPAVKQQGETTTDSVVAENQYLPIPLNEFIIGEWYVDKPYSSTMRLTFYEDSVYIPCAEMKFRYTIALPDTIYINTRVYDHEMGARIPSTVIVEQIDSNNFLYRDCPTFCSYTEELGDEIFTRKDD